MKRLITLALASALLVATFVPAFASADAIVIDVPQDPNASTDATASLDGIMDDMQVGTDASTPAMISEAAPTEAQMPTDPAVTTTAPTSKYVAFVGTVESVDADAMQVTVKDAMDQLLVLNISAEETLIVDNETREGAKLSDIEIGSNIYAWHAQMMTMSIPAQTPAYALVVNVAEGSVAPNFIEAEGIMKNDDGSYKVLSESQDLFVNIPADTKVDLFGTTPSVMRPGTMFIAWYDAVGMSLPAQASSADILVFPYSYDGYISVIGYDVSVNGVRIGQQACEGCASIMIPIESVARRLGFKVEVSEDGNKVTLIDGDKTVSYEGGVDTVIVDGEEYFSIAPMVLSKTMFVEYDSLMYFTNYKLAAPVM